MGIRETMNKNPAITTGGTIAIIVAAIGFLVWTQRPVRPPEAKAFYTTDDGKTFFPDSPDLVAPFMKNGKEALKAVVVTCDGGKTTYVAYVQRVLPAGKKLIEEQPKRFPPGTSIPIEYQMAIDSATEVKRPGPGKWEGRSPMNMRAVNAIVMSKCPDGKLATPVFE